jgi:hypothetical protein
MNNAPLVRGRESMRDLGAVVNAFAKRKRPALHDSAQGFATSNSETRP